MAIASTPYAAAVSDRRPGATPLIELLDDGFHLLALLRQRARPRHYDSFVDRVLALLRDFERNALAAGKAPPEIEQARYAFCAALDEVVLSSDFPLRAEWERQPLQLRLFGEHLAGEGFFERLAALRLAPHENIECLEVFHACLLLGFRGKYLLDDSDRIRYLQRTLAQELQRVRGDPQTPTALWKLPEEELTPPRSGLPTRFYAGILLVVGLAFFALYQVLLDQRAQALFGV